MLNQDVKKYTQERIAQRQAFFSNEIFPVDIKFDGKDFTGQVYDLSPFGVGLIVNSALARFFKLGLHAVLSFKLEGNPTLSAVLRSADEVRFSGSLFLKLGFELLEDAIPLETAELVKITGDALPILVCDDPIHFGRYHYFQVTELSSNLVKLKSSKTNLSLIPALEISSLLFIPLNGEHKTKIRILQVIKNSRAYECVAQLIEPSLSLKSAVSEFLLATGCGLTVAMLRQRGFVVSSIEKALLFEYANSPQSMDEVLKLRLLAANHAGRWIGETDHNKLRDDFDSQSRQIVCRIGDEVIASSRIVFNFKEKNLSEHTGYGIEIPRWLWDEGFVEVSRVCTNPDFRGSDVFIGMLRHLGRVTIQSGHRYIVLNCADSLVPIYQRVGAKSLNKRFFTPYMKEEALNLLYIDVEKCNLGGIGILNWCVIAKPIGQYLIKNGHLKPNLFERIKLKFATLIAPIVLRFHTRKKLKKGRE